MYSPQSCIKEEPLIMSSHSSTISKWYTWSFITILSGLFLLFILLPKSYYSELENRKLQGVPQFTWMKLFEGQFTKDAETYITDHFPYRDQWVVSKSILERLRLQQENNGIYRGKDGYLFEKLEAPDYDKLEQYTNAVNEFAKRHHDKNITFLLAPTSIGLYQNKLPWLAQSYSQQLIHQFIAEQVAANMTWIDGYTFLEPMKNSSKPIFYKTDHHWTSYGAYLAYEAYAKQQGWHAATEEDFTITTVSDSFLGSYHTRSLFSGIKPDSIEIYTPVKPVSSELYIADTNTTSHSLYDPTYLTKKDQYSYFQGGVHALMQIVTELNAKQVDLDKLLIIKDSYAHSVLPFLVSHVKELHVIDIRYYNGSIDSYMEEHQINDALLLFNSSTFKTEQNILKLKY